ncbi:putative phosphoglycerate mutase [Xylaria bambusicola]|uniref:putative phosphoglycerate mutase n=1 Tax=Xylaria bambusicola TaxID=326684 RepID=UPI002007E840|nr:putative phosphoglycerate mutase [Xylaria bambusicola]KAI0513310.1 putative phosphoglycerate mutase [Xylaria bambusicola]
MSGQDGLTPRVRNGPNVARFTGTTEIELTKAGVGQVSSAAVSLVGTGKRLDPQTFELLLPHCQEEKVTFTEDIAEWDYGNYEGLNSGEIRDSRKKRGLDLEMEWDIWRDGCEGGESRQQVTERLDRLILQIQDIQKPYMNGEKPADVAHGLILRCLVKRRLDFSIDFTLQMMLALLIAIRLP